ncbi:MAG TPA: nucleoside-diphosphate sugar epimerase/dehydratase [Phycisphaerae bacterium]
MNDTRSLNAPPHSPERIPLLLRFRTLIVVSLHTLLFAGSLLTAFALAYNFHNFFEWFGYFVPLLAICLPIKLLVFWWVRQYRGSWRYVSLRDLFGIAVAAQISSALIVAICWAVALWLRRLEFADFRQSVFVLDLACTIGFVTIARVLVRFYYEEIRANVGQTVTRALIVGAGDSGEALLREIRRMPNARYDVVGFLDDTKPRSAGTIHGVDVLGRTDHIRPICERLGVEEVLIALPSARSRDIRALIDRCEGTSLRFRTIPAISDVIEGRAQFSQIRDVDIEDLLGRDPVQLDTDAIGGQLRGKRILVTGAGGSIGAEMCRQIARFAPQRLILVEQAENNLFEIDRELRRSFPSIDVVPYVADICDAPRIRGLFQHEKPAAVFHAAAHKHVPMMELNPGEAIKNNVLGTKTVADAAVEIGVDKMVIISTDKAVNPTSIMGCTKRVAEMYVQQASSRGRTHFVTVRFGNVLGSSGSVVPIFKQQIAAGGPVTVTHPEMTRYFMTIPEAAQLVLQAGAMGAGGEIFLLEMGDPVKIIDLARRMITLSGLRPGIDIQIVYTGVRPGEKLFEELLIEGEGIHRTRHPKICIWQNRPEDWDRLCRGIDELLRLADNGTPAAIQQRLKELVPEYRRESPANNGLADTAATPAPLPTARPEPALGVQIG